MPRRARSKPSAAQLLNRFARNLALQDASSVPLTPRTNALIRAAIESQLAAIRANGHTDRVSDFDIELAMADYGRTLQRSVRRP